MPALEVGLAQLKALALHLTRSTATSEPTSSSRPLPLEVGIMPYESLPTELWSLAFSHLDSRKDRSTLASICLVSKFFDCLARPILFSTFQINSQQSNEHLTQALNVDGNGEWLGSLVKEAEVEIMAASGVVDLSDTRLFWKGGSFQCRRALFALRLCGNIHHLSFVLDRRKIGDDSWTRRNGLIQVPHKSLLFQLPCTSVLRSLSLKFGHHDDHFYDIQLFGEFIVACPQLEELSISNVINLSALLSPLMRSSNRTKLPNLARLTVEAIEPSGEDIIRFRMELSICLNNITSVRHLTLRAEDICGSFWNTQFLSTTTQPMSAIQTLRMYTLCNGSDGAGRLNFLQALFPSITQLHIYLKQVSSLTCATEAVPKFEHLQQLSLDFDLAIHHRLHGKHCSYLPVGLDIKLQEWEPLFEDGKPALPVLQKCCFRFIVADCASKDEMNELAGNMRLWAEKKVSCGQQLIAVKRADQSGDSVVTMKEKGGNWLRV